LRGIPLSPHFEKGNIGGFGSPKFSNSFRGQQLPR
jgi:hypothetical protein